MQGSSNEKTMVKEAAPASFWRRFALEEKLGEGAAGWVYRVRLLEPWNEFEVDHPFALKVYKAEVSRREDQAKTRERRRREHVILKSCTHRNLVRAFSIGASVEEDLDPKYLLMECIEGDTLDKFESTYWSSEQLGAMTFEIMAPLADAVRMLHEHGIIHRDIKPANIKLATERSSSAFLLDFGVAHCDEFKTITDSTAFLGTVRYAAPEWHTGKASKMCDIYGLGGVTYRILTGKDLWSGIDNWFNIHEAARVGKPNIDDVPCSRLCQFAVRAALQMLSNEPQLRPEIGMVAEFFARRDQSDLWKAIRSDFIHSTCMAEWSDLGHAIALEASNHNADMTSIDEALVKGDLAALLETLIHRNRAFRAQILSTEPGTSRFVGLAAALSREQQLDEPAVIAYLDQYRHPKGAELTEAIRARAKCVADPYERDMHILVNTSFERECHDRLAALDEECRTRATQHLRSDLAEVEERIASLYEGVKAEQDRWFDYDIDPSPDDVSDLNAEEERADELAATADDLRQAIRLAEDGPSEDPVVNELRSRRNALRKVLIHGA